MKKIIAALLLAAFAPLELYADDVFRIEPYISIQEEFTDNVNLSPTNKRSDLISTVAPGIRLSDTTGTSALNLDYTLGLNFFARDSGNNYTSHTANFSGYTAPNPNWTLSFREFYVRSDDPRERQFTTTPGTTAGTETSLLSFSQGRFIHWRNVIEPSASYRFGPEDVLALAFRNNLYRTENPFSEDSREDFISPSLTYWFNQSNGFQAQYSFVSGDFEFTPDLKGHEARGRYMVRTSRSRIFFVEYGYLRRTFDAQTLTRSDYDVHTPSVGTDYAFSPTLSGRLQLGYFWFEPKTGSSASGPSGEISILQRLMTTSVAVGARFGYREDYFTPENLGFSKFYGIFGNLTHQWTQRTSVGVNTAMEWADYVFDRNDRVWTTGATVAYQPLRWLTLNVEVSHRENSSSVSGFDFKENRFLVRLTAAYL